MMKKLFLFMLFVLLLPFAYGAMTYGTYTKILYTSQNPTPSSLTISYQCMNSYSGNLDTMFVSTCMQYSDSFAPLNLFIGQTCKYQSVVCPMGGWSSFYSVNFPVVNTRSYTVVQSYASASNTQTIYDTYTLGAHNVGSSTITYIDKCAGVTCASGYYCSGSTGTCIAQPVQTQYVDKCKGVTCQSGYHCDGSTGGCVVDPINYVTNYVNKCQGVTCQSGYHCDGSTGGCVADPINYVNRCQGVVCQANYHCDGTNGLCIANPTQYIDSCRDIQCDAVSYCSKGSCLPKPVQTEYLSKCQGVTCAADEYCDGLEGQCLKTPQKLLVQDFINWLFPDTCSGLCNPTQSCINGVCYEQASAPFKLSLLEKISSLLRGVPV